MQMGMGVLRLSPQDFWRATPREIASAFGGGGRMLTRLEFDDLMQRFPDET